MGAHDPMCDSEATVAAAREGLSGLPEAISLPDEGHIFGRAGDEFVRDAAPKLFAHLAG